MICEKIRFDLFCQPLFYQFIRAVELYLPLTHACDLFIDTSQAAVWVLPEHQALLADIRK